MKALLNLEEQSLLRKLVQFELESARIELRKCVEASTGTNNAIEGWQKQAERMQDKVMRLVSLLDKLD